MRRAYTIFGPSIIQRSKTVSLESYFAPFRSKVIGIDHRFASPYGTMPIVYADWTASGRLYEPIERRMAQDIAPFVANTHTETSYCGITMTKAYHEALHTIKRHVNAGPNDAIICYHAGMTAVVNKLQRIMGLRVHERYREDIVRSMPDRPVVFISHMEHHSNQTSWLETIADVRVIGHTADGLVDLDDLRELLAEYADRSLKIAAITSCSNVTGMFTPYHDVAEIVHEAGGYCFVDFACSAPYIDIDMHPADRPNASLDAIFFSPHKFLGGPGSSGVLVFSTALYRNTVPDNPGGGTVDFTNPWGVHKYTDDIEAREDGGTPGFMQAIRTALCIALKEQMGVPNIMRREEELLGIMWDDLLAIPNVHVLADHHRHRLGVISFYIDDLHYNLAVQLLNDRFGIQARGGCSCAGTYGHYLLEISADRSTSILDRIACGDLSQRPGWVRISLHPTMTDDEARYIVDAIRQLAMHHAEWASDYDYMPSNVFVNRERPPQPAAQVHPWFSLAD